MPSAHASSQLKKYDRLVERFEASDNQSLPPATTEKKCGDKTWAKGTSQTISATLLLISQT